MFEKPKKPGKVENFFLKPKPKKSHKQRNILIGLGAVSTAAFAIAGVIARNQDQS